MHWAEDGWHNGCFIQYFINIWGVPYNILSIFRGIQYIILSIFFKSSSWWQTQGYLLFVWKQTNICGVKIAIVCCGGLNGLVAGFEVIKELTCGISCRTWECMVGWPRMRDEYWKVANWLALMFSLLYICYWSWPFLTQIIGNKNKIFRSVVAKILLSTRAFTYSFMKMA